MGKIIELVDPLPPKKAPPWLVKYARDIEAKLKEKNT
jgi:hypothetical protein